MALEKKYSGRVSSKKNGCFFSANQSYMGISALPTEESARLQPLYIAHTNPSTFLAKYPRILVTLQDDGSVENIERDVVFVDSNGETHSAEDAMSADGSIYEEGDDSVE
tara:strand:- start:203 stop:529 length:327 start_codon:yes stop_codon:yes gene_type:complete